MDDVILNKITIIERCINRIKEEYNGHEKELESNYTKQDSIELNLERACETSIDLGTHIIRIQKLGIPQSSRDVFVLLEQNNIIDKMLSKKLQKMVGFRNIAIHDYQAMNLDILKNIIKNNLNDFLAFTKVLLKK